MDTWICDSCGGLIEQEDGWVEWVSRAPLVGRGLRLVHHIGRVDKPFKCMYDQQAEFAKDQGTVSDLDLSSFLGADGLIQLLVFISDKQLPTEEVLEMIKRLHIPGYEHARKHFKKAIDEGVFEPNMPPNYYWQEDIQATLRYMKEKDA